MQLQTQRLPQLCFRDLLELQEHLTESPACSSLFGQTGSQLIQGYGFRHDEQLPKLCAPAKTDENRHQLAACDDLLRDEDVPERPIRLRGKLLVQGALHLGRCGQTLRDKKVADPQNSSLARGPIRAVQCRHLVLVGMVGHHVTKSLKL